MNLTSHFAGKTALVTGNTGFKGTWLSEWLLMMGAKVVGYSLGPPTLPACFSACGTAERITDIRADVRDADALYAALDAHRPHFIFHLAAQPLVIESYQSPRDTFATNCIGSVNMLDALRRLARPCIVVMITTDKVYANQEWDHAYRENDELGGYDPYSASKACAELAIASYRRSFFDDWHNSDAPVIAVASARGGNIVGGGDWAKNRIIPDCIRSIAAQKDIEVRHPAATRPWQHVLELSHGYLTLAASMQAAKVADDKPRLRQLCDAFNFGPNNASNRSVADIVDELLRHWRGNSRQWRSTGKDGGHEAYKLHLAIEKSHHQLGWQPKWDFSETMRRTAQWYQRYLENPSASAAIAALCREQINAYLASANAA